MSIEDRVKTLEVLKGFIDRDKASVSDAQRHHQLGYHRATKIFNQLQLLRCIESTPEGMKPSINMKQYEKLKSISELN